MSAFGELGESAPLRVWQGIAARAVGGERATLAVFELDAGAVVPEHAHDNEQLGICVQGGLRFRIGDEERDVVAGSTWAIPPNVPHSVVVGPDGCVLVETFVPRRDEWTAVEREAPRRPRWP